MEMLLFVCVMRLLPAGRDALHLLVFALYLFLGFDLSVILL